MVTLTWKEEVSRLDRGGQEGEEELGLHDNAVVVEMTGDLLSMA